MSKNNSLRRKENKKDALKFFIIIETLFLKAKSKKKIEMCVYFSDGLFWRVSQGIYFFSSHVLSFRKNYYCMIQNKNTKNTKKIFWFFSSIYLRLGMILYARCLLTSLKFTYDVIRVYENQQKEKNNFLFFFLQKSELLNK